LILFFSIYISDESEVTLRRYKAAFILELIGVVMLPSGSGDAMPAMYVQFLHGFGGGMTRYSWASAVLACLYHNLCRAAMGDANSIAGN
jgi:hypothetical protein